MQGSACLILPEPPEPKVAKSNSKRGPGIKKSVGAASAELTAVICRVRLTLAELSVLSPGDVMPLTTGRLDKTELVTISGQRITTGQMGQTGGFRAIRLAGYMPKLMATPDEFDTSISLPAPEPEPDPVLGSTILDGTVLSEIETNADAEVPSAMGDDDDALFAGLSIHEAALEISELAGLPPPGSEEEEEAAISSGAV